MSTINTETGLYQLEDGDKNLAAILNGEYIPPLTSEGSPTYGVITAWLQFIAQYAINPYNIADGFNFSGETIELGKVKYDINDADGYISTKIVAENGSGLTIFVDGTTNKVMKFSLNIQESNSTAVISLLKDSKTLKKLEGVNGVNITSTDDTITFEVDPSYFTSENQTISNNTQESITGIVTNKKQYNLNIENAAQIIANKNDVLDRILAVGETRQIKTTLTDFNSIETAGGVRSNGGNWKDINIDVTTLTGGGTAPALNTLTGNLKIAGFAPNQINEVSTSLEVQHDRKSGTPISFHAHCYPTNTDTGVVRLGLEYIFTYENETLPTPTTIYAEEAMLGTVGLRKTISFADITVPTDIVGTDFTPQLHFRFFRDATHVNDTYTGDVNISTIGFHYDSDAFGSDTIIMKS